MLTLHHRLFLQYLPLLLWSSCGLAFTLVSWNINQISSPDQKRVNALLNTVMDTHPEILMLQEGDSDVLRTLKSNQGAKAGYHYFYAPTKSGDPSGGLIILAQRSLPVEPIRYEVFPSEMERGALILPIQLCGKRVMLANVHLESPDLLTWSQTRDFRRQQVQSIKHIAQGVDDWIVAGDFNSVFETDADRWFTQDWQDAWLALHPENPGLTWDPDRNALAWRQGGFVLPGFRLDRLVYKSDELVPVAAELMGLGAEPPLSDHFGLKVSFDCRSTN